MSASRSRRALVAGALAGVLALVAGCSGEERSAEGVEAEAARGATVLQAAESGRSAAASPLLERMRDAALGTPHTGLRRYEVHRYRDGGDLELSYTERVADRGDGCYSITPLDVRSNHVDPFVFRGIQVERQAFTRRYRDFRIEDPALFLENYTLRDVGGETVVAGRPCERLVARSKLDGREYELAIDRETALVLGYRETRADGALLSSMTYEEFEPSVGEVDCFENSITEEELVLRGGLAEQIGFEVWRPSLLPDGYWPQAASRVRDPRGFDWLKLTYGDGVETLFFLQREPDRGPRVLAEGQPADAHDDRILVYEESPLAVVQGTLGSRDVIAVGKVESHELLRLLESSRLAAER